MSNFSEPNTIQAMNIIIDGVGNFGRGTKVALPKLSRKIENAKTGTIPLPYLTGEYDPLKMTFSYHSFDKEPLQWLSTDFFIEKPLLIKSNILINNKEAKPWMATARGYVESYEQGELDFSKKIEVKISLALVAYHIIYDGDSLLNIDIPDLVFEINNKDMAKHISDSIAA